MLETEAKCLAKVSVESLLDVASTMYLRMGNSFAPPTNLLNSLPNTVFRLSLIDKRDQILC